MRPAAGLRAGTEIVVGGAQVLAAVVLAPLLRRRYKGWTVSGGRPVPQGGPAVWDLPEGPYEYARGRVDPRSIEWNVPPLARAPDYRAGRPGQPVGAGGR